MKKKKYKNNPKITAVLVVIIVIFTGLISLQTSAYAAIYKVNSNKRINIEISQTGVDRKSTRLNSSHSGESRMPSSA